jgi:1-acyl-sn-glycerol-3-phosphate acyltransferase
MSSRGYRFGTACGRFVFVQTVRCKALRPEMMNRKGPFILACTHLSHTDPFLLSIYVKSRHIDWMARIEFWKFKFGGWFMEWMDAIPVRRFGVSANAIRTAINRLKEGRVVGICPEGGVAQGVRSVMRGGQMKKGVCLISYRAGIPILPCVMLGTDKLNRVPPWIPPLRAKLWIGFGDHLIYPRTDIHDRRAARDAMAEELSKEYQKLFIEVKERFGLTEADVP